MIESWTTYLEGAGQVADPAERETLERAAKLVTPEARSSGPVDLFDGVHLRFLPGDALLLQTEGDAEL